MTTRYPSTTYELLWSTDAKIARGCWQSGQVRACHVQDVSGPRLAKIASTLEGNSVTTEYESGSLSYERKQIAARWCLGDFNAVVAALQELRAEVPPGKQIYVAFGSLASETEVVMNLTLVEDTIEDGRVIYSIFLDAFQGGVYGNSPAQHHL
jgi:hypothetical protein